MATQLQPQRTDEIDYPTGDGRPMAETDIHRDLMMDLIGTLDHRFADDAQVYVSGNLLVFYVEGDPRRHISPDVFVVRGIPKYPRENYLIWREGKAPQVVIELTSKSTRNEDERQKFHRYQDYLKVQEYFMFDPRDEYLDPPFQGYRLHKGEYEPIEFVDGRLPSEVLGLHLESIDGELRLYDPATQTILPTVRERAESEAQRADSAERLASQQAERARQESERARQESERARQESERAERETTARLQAEADNARLLQELDELRRQLGK